MWRRKMLSEQNGVNLFNFSSSEKMSLQDWIQPGVTSFVAAWQIKDWDKNKIFTIDFISCRDFEH